MAEMSAVWQDNSPDSLLDLAIKVCIQNPQTICKYNCNTTEHVLQDEIALPEEICERILFVCNEQDEFINDKILTLFKDSSRTRLRSVKVPNSLISDASMEIISRHDVTELDISCCPRLTTDTRKFISRLSKSLISLTVGKSSDIFINLITNDSFILGKELIDLDNYVSSESEACSDGMDCLVRSKKVCLDAPNLRKLVIHHLKMSVNYFPDLLEPLQRLTHLDLSQCSDLSDLNYLASKRNLTCLILFNVRNLQNAVPSICLLESLRHLDISQTDEETGRYKNPNQVLKRIVDSLPNLESLDISGTNLAGNRFQERDDETLSNSSLIAEEKVDHLQTDIPGLKSRVNRPLEFLGLFNTAHEACYRHHIPAKKIAGNANEEQILTAAQVYCGRASQIQKVLNDLFHVFRYETCQNTRLALDVVIQAMRRHLSERYIQISGSASLFYLVRGEIREHFNIKVKKTIIKTVLNAMSAHMGDVTMLRNICLTLIHFKIPDDVLFEYKRLVKLLLKAVTSENQDEFVQRIAVYLLNSLACQVDGFHKELFGDLGAIATMLDIVKNRLERNLCDEVMECAWSTMWNVTDETPSNCKAFLRKDGMDYFLKCLKAFPDKAELLRNMMGLLGNVAEVKELRPRLMHNEYLATFSKLLDSTSDGIEVSYNAAGILAHIASDGSALWDIHNITCVTYEEVYGRMEEAIERWDLSAKRNINYRSFEPIFRLLSAHHASVAQFWAVWALANLTKVYPEKYCPLLVEENGLKLLETLISTQEIPSKICNLACIIIYHCQTFETNKSSESIEKSSTDSD